MENTKKFLGFFNLKLKKDKLSKEKTILPKNISNGKESTFTPENMELYEYYLKRLTANSDSWAGRTELFDDCDQMYLNNPIVSRNVKTLVFETLQRDLNDNPIKIASPNDKTIAKIQDLFDRIALNDIIQDIAFQVVQYGNSLGLLSFSEKGISRMIPVKNIREFKNRIEFNIADVKNMKATGKDGNTVLKQSYDNFDRMKYMIDNIENDADETDEFVDYLLGYEVNDQVFPAWRGIHFRYRDVIRPFRGFGTPFFINSISPHMQYVNAMVLQAVARTLRIPTDVYKITMGEGMSPTEKLKKVIQFMAEFQNSGIGAKKKDIKGVGDVRYTIEGLYEWSQQIPDIDLGQIDDIELLRDDVIVSGILPKEWVDPRESGWGDSGIALKEKSKPFQRAVYSIQSVLLEGLTLLVQLDLIESGEELEDNLFTLSLPYPQSQVNSDLITSQKDQIDLATSIIDTLTDKLSGGEALPDELVYDIYRQFLPYDDQKIKDWYDRIKKARSVGDDEVDENRLNETHKKIKESLKKLKYKNIQEAIEKTKTEIIINTRREGIFENKHYYSSKNQTLDFSLKGLSDYRVSKIKKIRETGKKNLSDKEKFDLVIKEELSKFVKNNEVEEDDNGTE